jgi:GPH family glycoside/pentoside/hexuronide:cation symporter
MINKEEKIPFFEKFSYGLGDTASNLFWMNFVYFLSYFYTDVFGIGAAVAGTMFAVTRVWDACIDPIFGMISDRTETRWGKFRPYLLWFAIPFGIVGALTFTTPSLGMHAKIIYAYITYSLMMIVYSAINIPYGSMMAVVSSNPNVRSMFSQYRFILAFTGGLMVEGGTLPIVNYIGSNDHSVVNAQIINNKSIVITEYGEGTSKLALDITKQNHVVSTSLPGRFWNFILIKTGVDDSKTEKSLTISILRPEQKNEIDTASKIHFLTKGFVHDTIAISSIAGNIDYQKCQMKLRVVNERKGFQWAMFCFSIFAVIMFLITFLATKERVKPPKEQKTEIKRDLADLMKNRPWALLFVIGIFMLSHVCLRNGSIMYYFKYFVGNKDLASLFMIFGTLSTLAAIPLTGWAARTFGKKLSYVTCMYITSILSMCYFFLDKSDIKTMFALQVGINFFFGSTAPLIFAMYTDTVDYSEWKTGRRATGLVMSASTMAQKFGWAIGGALTLFILAAFNFKPNTEQTSGTIGGIVAMLSWVPALASVIAGTLMLFYPLSKSRMKTIVDDLNDRRLKEE